MKRLFWDIETSPNVCLSWRVGYKINLDCDNILKERSIICIGYKWEHEKKAHVITWDKEQNDKTMLQRFLKIANDADELIAHNGDNFDLPWFLTRCAYHGINTFPAYKTSDTLQWARRKFYFNSNKLNYIAQYLGIGAKLHTGFGLWKAIVLNRCPKSLRKMSNYCARDVELLEKVWKRLAALVPHKTHAGVMAGKTKWSCPRCESENVKLNKTRVTAAGTVQKQMRCNKCGGNYTVNYATFEAYKEAKKKDK